LAEVKRIPGFERRFWTRMIAAFAGCGGAMVFFIHMSRIPGASGVWTWLAMTCVFALITAFFRINFPAFNRFRCPTCDQLLPVHEEKRKRGRSLRFLCTNCDTLWDSNITQDS
jgi:hypothetical protein